MQVIAQALENLSFAVLEWGRGFLMNFTYLFRGEYYISLFRKYFSFGGFLIGLILVLILYFANPDTDHPYKGFLRVLAMVAVINCCYTLNIALCGMFRQEYLYGNDGGIVAMFFAPDNILSGCILAMVVTNDMYRKPRCAVLMGAAAHLTMPMLNYSLFGSLGSAMGRNQAEILIVMMIVQVALTLVLCWILCYRRYFFTAWIWYFCTHMLLRVFYFFYGTFQYVTGSSGGALGALLKYLKGFGVDYFVFLLVLAVGIFFEKGVLTKKQRRRAGA